MASAHFQGIGNLVYRNLQLVGKFLRTRTALILLLELAECLTYLIQRTNLVQGQTYDTALLRQSLKNGLANPPHRITDELESTGFVELLSSFYQA